MDANMLTQFSNQLTKKTVYLDLPENVPEDYIFNLLLFLTSMNATDIQLEGGSISFTPPKKI
jgi:hypothetical protein